MIFQKKDTRQTQAWLQQQLGDSKDVVFQKVNSDKKQAQLLYINSVCDEDKIQDHLLKPFFEIDEKGEYERYLHSLPSYQVYDSDQDTLQKIVHGSVVIFLDSHIFLIDVKKVQNNSVSEANVETVIQGPQNAMSENIDINFNLIRHRYHQASLQMEQQKLGTVSQTKVAMIYDEQYVKSKVLKEVKGFLERIDVKVLQDAGQLHQYLTNKRRNLFPTLMITERPDRVVFNLAYGKVVLLIEGTPFALIVPAVFYDFMSTMEDLYQPYWVSRFLILLRYIGLVISTLLPALYIFVTAYNPEIFRVQLALSIAGTRIGVPFPAFFEVLFMLLMVELLIEASIRLPKQIGGAATTVGGLVLGQAASEAGLVSNIMIIIVGAVAISNFVIPINPMSFAMRVMRYVMVFVTTIFGTVGLVIGVIGLVAYLAHLESFGQPYLKLFMIDDPAKVNKDTKKEKEEVGSS